ncbi:MAG: hypothetical protein ACLFUS_14105 [Candidatus Sumerlaeia bacterium]
MSERITHTALLDDCVRLVSASSCFHPAFAVVLEQYHPLARLGSATKHGDRFNVQLLSRLRDMWEAHTRENHLERRLAFVLGWLCHRAADRQMKPVFRANDDGSKPKECSIYCDVHVLKKVYVHDANSIYPAEVIGLREPVEGAQWEKLRDLFHTLLEQSLIELHTFTPDPEDPWGWVDRLCDAHIRFHVDVDRYARAYADPDPAKQKQYVEDTCFYADDDPLIIRARDIQTGKSVAAEAVDEAIDADHRSHYGLALQISMHYLRAASAFFSGKLEAEKLSEALNIGKPGRDGLGV